MLKNLSQLELKIGEKIYRMTCDIDSPLNDVKEALFQFQKYVGQIEDNVRAQQEAQKAEKDAEKPPEESKVEVA